MRGMKMVMSFKIDKQIKQALQTLADKEYRSLSNYVVMVLKKHLDEKGIDWHKSKKNEH
jgi:predicted transcriptional regulator